MFVNASLVLVFSWISCCSKWPKYSGPTFEWSGVVSRISEYLKTQIRAECSELWRGPAESALLLYRSPKLCRVRVSKVDQLLKHKPSPSLTNVTAAANMSTILKHRSTTPRCHHTVTVTLKKKFCPNIIFASVFTPTLETADFAFPVWPCSEVSRAAAWLCALYPLRDVVASP